MALFMDKLKQQSSIEHDEHIAEEHQWIQHPLDTYSCGVLQKYMADTMSQFFVLDAKDRSEPDGQPQQYPLFLGPNNTLRVKKGRDALSPAMHERRFILAPESQKLTLEKIRQDITQKVSFVIPDEETPGVRIEDEEKTPPQPKPKPPENSPMRQFTYKLMGIMLKNNVIPWDEQGIAFTSTDTLTEAQTLMADAARAGLTCRRVMALRQNYPGRPALAINICGGSTLTEIALHFILEDALDQTGHKGITFELTRTDINGGIKGPYALVVEETKVFIINRKRFLGLRKKP